MKKLAGITWAADSSYLRRVYIRAVQPIMEYGNMALATAAKTNTTRLCEVQNAGFRLITGAMKTTPIEEMERCNPDGIKFLQQYEDKNLLEGASIFLDVPGTDRNKNHHPHKLTLEMIEKNYDAEKWTRARKNGGAVVIIYHADEQCTFRYLPTRKTASNFRAEAGALLRAISILTEIVPTPSKVAIFTDFRFDLQSMQKPSAEKQFTDIQTNIRKLFTKPPVFLEWISSHCGIYGNEKADECQRKQAKWNNLLTLSPTKKQKPSSETNSSHLASQ
ncbi:hypothetical protein ElyMa_003539700 [Elysia marginata]|uniref:RNase H type-1 domain-containing protein n=1 Tax=Elysia marginata TaxID=1093978 RepID=A0AAV4EJ04_9GAST|nr:hypothetical protein ElyMa_003539700 [Elysia marginata]